MFFSKLSISFENTHTHTQSEFTRTIVTVAPSPSLPASPLQVIGCDIAVSAIGVSPNTGMLGAEFVQCAEGVVVDYRMHTSVNDVYAAGDCCSIIEAGNQALLGTSQHISAF